VLANEEYGGIVKFDLSDINGMFEASAGSDYALLKGFKSEEPSAPERVSTALLGTLPKLAVGT